MKADVRPFPGTDPSRAASTPVLSMRGLAYVPFLASWLLENRAFNSGDARLVRAVPRLLMYAWDASPAGSIPADFERIAGICGLHSSDVEAHHEALLEGWTLRAGRLFHDQMSALCAQIGERYGEFLERLATASAAAVQSPDEFELAPPEAATSRTRGRHLLPLGFALTLQRRTWMAEHNIPDSEDQDFVFEKFVSNARRSNEMMTNWEAAFHNFVLKENLRNLPSRSKAPAAVAGSGGFGGRSNRFGGGSYGSAARGEQACDHNLDVLGIRRREGTRA